MLIGHYRRTLFERRHKALCVHTCVDRRTQVLCVAQRTDASPVGGYSSGVGVVYSMSDERSDRPAKCPPVYGGRVMT